MNENKITNNLAELWEDLTIERYEEIESTNDCLKNHYRNNHYDERLIIANRQTKGRGRRTRNFYSKLDHGLYFSLGINASGVYPNELPLYTIAAATAMIQAVDKELGIQLKVKWVNDLFYRGKKVAGILSEAITNPQTNEISFLVVGIGLNIAGSLDEADELTKKTAGTLYNDLPSNLNVDRLINQFLIEFFHYHKNLKKRSFISLYEKNLLGVGEKVYYQKRNKKYYGRINGINKKGQLLIQNESNEEEVLLADEIHFSSRQFVND